MKIKLFILIAFSNSIALVNAQTTQYEWDYVSTLQNEWFKKICTQGLDTVYVIGRNGLIAQSTNRALTWTKQYPVSAQLNDIIFCNHNTGFAVGNNGTILKTTNAGTTWTPQLSGITNNLNAIAATGLDNIWAVGDNGTALFSTNAGLTWQQKNFSVSVKLNDVSFKNNEGYIVGNAHTCFVSDDYGSNWIFKDITVENPSNLPVSIFDLLSINQTENHTCILFVKDLGQYYINVDNNTFIYPYHLTLNNFTMQNDSIGYGSSLVVTTGSEACNLSVEIFNLNKYPYSSNYMGVGGANTFLFHDFDPEHADMSFTNDSIGYLASGSVLYYLKKYIPPVIHDGLSNTINNKLLIEGNSTQLTIRFENTNVEKIELYSIAGLKVLTENINTNETSKSINITDFSKGIYIIRVCYRDNTFTNTKWIRQ